MSSSRIIKTAEHDGASISDFFFQALGHGHQVVSTPIEHAGSGFVPLGIYQPESQDDSGAAEEVDSGPPPLEISEEELRQRVNEAFNEGLKEGKELAERGLINVFRALRSASESIHNLRDKVIRESEDDILDLIMLLARKVIIREVSEDRTILAEVVRNALSGLTPRDVIAVRVNPDDFQLATSGRDEVLHKELLSEQFQLRPDPSVPAGFCQIDTEMGTVDASLDGQLEQLYRALLEQRTVATSETLS